MCLVIYMKWLKGKKVLITGCCGTVGRELVDVLLSDAFGELAGLLGVDNNETSLFFLKQDYLQNKNASFYLADIRDSERVHEIMAGVDVVFHAAALKHVEICETSPFDAVQTNIHGVKNIIKAALYWNVGKVIFTSSDKAVNPTNVMGTSKLMGERLITAANIQNSGSQTIFASTRFGNVLGSNGSVLPLFIRQIKSEKNITLTDRRMTRFVMSCRSAAELVVRSGGIAQGGEVFITKMPVIKIEDLALALIDHYKKKDILIKEVGVKAGEKLYEELMTDEESSRAYEINDYFVILPAFKEVYEKVSYSYLNGNSDTVSNCYVSSLETSMAVSEIRDYLLKEKLVDFDEGK